MRTSWADSVAASEAENAVSGSSDNFRVGVASQPTKGAYVPPNLRNRQQSSELMDYFLTYRTDTAISSTQTAHVFAYLIWSFLQILLRIWHLGVGIFNMLESHSISSGLLRKYSALDANKLNYLAIVVESEDARDTSKIIELLQWLSDIGVRHVCLYDMEGVLKKLKEVIIAKCNAKSMLWQVVDATKALDDPNQRTLEFASFSDGKEGVVKAANLLFMKYLKSREQGVEQVLPNFTEKLMDDALTTIGCRGPDPDLLLVYGPARCHLGFPAFRMRYTEILHMGPLRLASYGLLLKAIYKFTTVRQNYGK